MVLAAPHHKAAAETHHVIFDVDKSRLAPRFEKAVQGPATVEVLDVRSEEPSRVPPGPPAKHIAGRRHQRAGEEAPAQPPKRIRWNVEVEARHRTAWAQDAPQFAQSGCRVGNVSEQVGEGDRIE